MTCLLVSFSDDSVCKYSARRFVILDLLVPRVAADAAAAAVLVVLNSEAAAVTLVVILKEKNRIVLFWL